MGELFAIVLISGTLCGLVGRFIARNKGVSEGTGFTFGFFLGPLGLIIVALLNPTASSKRVIKSFDGTMDVTNDRYRLWLSEKFEVHHNPVLQRYVTGGESFGTLDEALKSADALERAELENEQELEAAAVVRGRRYVMVAVGLVVVLILGFGATKLISYVQAWRAGSRMDAVGAEWRTSVNSSLSSAGIRFYPKALFTDKDPVDLTNDDFDNIESRHGVEKISDYGACQVKGEYATVSDAGGKEISYFADEDPAAVFSYYTDQFSNSGYQKTARYETDALETQQFTKGDVVVFVSRFASPTKTFMALCISSRDELDRKLGKKTSVAVPQLSETSAPSAVETTSGLPSASVTTGELEGSTDWTARERRLIAESRSENMTCRGSSGDEPETWEACERREQIEKQLRAIGICYGRKDESGSQMGFHRCGPGSN